MFLRVIDGSDTPRWSSPSRCLAHWPAKVFLNVDDRGHSSPKNRAKCRWPLRNRYFSALLWS